MVWIWVGIAAGLIAVVALWMWLMRYEQHMISSAQQAILEAEQAQQALQIRWSPSGATERSGAKPKVHASKPKTARHRRNRRNKPRRKNG